MSETEIYAIFLGVLLCGVVTLITLIPLLDRWLDKWLARRAKSSSTSPAAAA